MRAIMLCAMVGQCAGGPRDAGPAPAITGVLIESGEGTSSGEPDLPRLDLGADEPLPGGTSTSTGAGGTSTGGPDVPTGGAGEMGGTSTGEPAPAESTGEPGTTGGTDSGESTGTSTSTGESTGAGTSTGEPGMDCPCQPGADNVCDLEPGACAATEPGGYCDPDGDGAFFDGDWTLGFQEYKAKCG